MDETRGYYIEGVLGTGGFGKVYLAEFRGPAQFTKRVAIKLLTPRPDMLPEIEARLRDEGRMLGLLGHPNIVGVTEITRLDGRWAVVMEYVRGLDLAYLLDQVEALPPGPALQCVEEVAKALHHATTELSLLHRDIKPSNILLTPFGQIKVLDFGVARAAFPEREAMTSSVFFGTPSYTAPEGFELRSCHGSDVYALGAVLFELLSGERFGRTSADSVKHRRNVTERLEVLQALDLPDGLVELVASTLAFEPDDRPTARAFEQAAAKIRRANATMSLAEWIDRCGVQVADPPLDSDPLCGRLLTDQTPTQSVGVAPAASSPDGAEGTAEQTLPSAGPSSAPRPAAPSDAAGPPSLGKTIAAGASLLLVGGGIAVLLSIGAGIATWYVLQAGSASDPAVGIGAVEVEAPRPMDPVLVSPMPDDVPDPVDAPEAVAPEVRPEPVPPPGPAASPATVPSPPAPRAGTPQAPPTDPPDPIRDEPPPVEAPPSTTAVGFTATSKVTNAFLVGPTDRRYDLPARVPPGEYRLMTLYAGADEASPVGRVTVGTDKLEVSCTLTGRSCSARPAP